MNEPASFDPVSVTRAIAESRRKVVHMLRRPAWILSEEDIVLLKILFDRS